MTDTGMAGSDGEMARVTVRVPERQLTALEAVVDRGLWPNRSEVLRDGLDAVLAAADGGSELPVVEIARIDANRYVVECSLCNSRHRHSTEPRRLEVGDTCVRMRKCLGPEGAGAYRLKRTEDTEVADE